MKWKFRLDDKFLSALPDDQANEVADAVKEIEDPFVQRKAEMPDLELGENTSAGLMSTPQVDRDREIVSTSGINIDMFEKNPVLMFNHKWGDPPIGSNSGMIHAPEGLWAKQSYSSVKFAQDIYTLVRERHLRTFSIGFVPLKRLFKGEEGFADMLEALPRMHPDAGDLTKAELITTDSILLENSVTGIPSNTGAEIEAVGKSLGLSPETIEMLGLKIVDEVVPEVPAEPEDKQLIIPKIRIVKRAQPVTVDYRKLVSDQIHLMKGGL